MIKLIRPATCAALFTALVSMASIAHADTSPQPTPNIDRDFNGGICTPHPPGGQTELWLGLLKGPFYCDDQKTIFTSVSDVYQKGFRVTEVYENKSHTQSEKVSPIDRGLVSIIVEKK